VQKIFLQNGTAAKNLKHMKNIHALLFILLAPLFLIAQRPDNPYSQDLKWRNIGPANMMGRIAAVDALDTDYRHVLCASASGGVFKSTNGGITWDAIFDRYGAGCKPLPTKS
jgi:hypothetical protein